MLCLWELSCSFLSGEQTILFVGDLYEPTLIQNGIDAGQVFGVVIPFFFNPARIALESLDKNFPLCPKSHI